MIFNIYDKNICTLHPIRLLGYNFHLIDNYIIIYLKIIIQLNYNQLI